MKKLIGYAVLVLLAAGMVFVLFNNKKKIAEQTASVADDGTVAVGTQPVNVENYTLEVTSNGLTAPVKELKFVSDVSGRVVKIYVENGSRVSRGTPLLEVDKELLQADYEAAKAAYESMEKNVGRFAASQEVGGVSDQQLESMETQLAAAKSRYEVSRRRLADATVKAPISGVINMKYVELGSLIAPNAPLFDIVDNSRLKVTCMLPDGKIEKVKKGQQVVLAPSGSSDREYTGKVGFIGVKSDRGLNYPVEIEIENGSGLKAGEYMKARFISEEGTTGILVPRSAIVGGLRSSIVYLFKDGTAVAQDVTLGEMADDRVEVLSGLEDGDEIIASGIMNISDGTKVKSIN
ncbi:MAG: efflux RND transporter periplasmic adaptor subunit [Bacteroidales bacterium]|nr:efflux RND transporter periplasmic adaptor subunit [Candidatus Equibacterium intestinale]